MSDPIQTPWPGEPEDAPDPKFVKPTLRTMRPTSPSQPRAGLDSWRDVMKTLDTMIDLDDEVDEGTLSCSGPPAKTV